MKLKTENRAKLSNKLLSFLSILKSSFEDIEEIVKEVEKSNPLINVRYKKFVTFSNYVQNSSTNVIENRLVNRASLYDDLKIQIENSHYFPTDKSKKIALKIVEDITNEGYFEGNIQKIAEELDVLEEDVEKIRGRFFTLDPAGVGAKDMKEAFLFQLENLDIDNQLYLFTKQLIEDFENIEK